MEPKFWFELFEGRIERATSHSAAFDLFATENYSIDTTPVAVSTGVKTRFSPNLVAIIKEKSGLALKHGLEVHGGVIDSDYRDEWRVILRLSHRFAGPGYGGRSLSVPKGTKIAQFLLLELPEVVCSYRAASAKIELKNVERTGGFGSTGSGTPEKFCLHTIDGVPCPNCGKKFNIHGEEVK